MWWTAGVVVVWEGEEGAGPARLVNLVATACWGRWCGLSDMIARVGWVPLLPCQCALPGERAKKSQRQPPVLRTRAQLRPYGVFGFVLFVLRHRPELTRRHPRARELSQGVRGACRCTYGRAFGFSDAKLLPKHTSFVLSAHCIIAEDGDGEAGNSRRWAGVAESRRVPL